MQVVVVESPSKAKTINKYLGSGFKVLASYGHIRDLPAKDGSVDPDKDFAMVWELDADSKKRINEIAEAVKTADRLILATDPDREGEAISWHILDVLEQKKALKGVKVDRVAFNAITKSAVSEAIANPRAIDQDLVDAYLARRALDYLVGFTLSPVLWRKLPGARSAGRVQSVALRLICEREIEIERFVAEEYWTIAAEVRSEGGQAFEARLFTLDGEKLKKFTLNNEAAALAAKKAIEAAKFRIESVEAKPSRRNPPPPFTTSTLQQEAARKLGFNAQRTMRVAQRLYEGVDVGGETTGLITYMRTDGVDMAGEAIADARRAIESSFGGNYVPNAPRIYKTKAKNAQEAHECIRPTSFSRSPQKVRGLEDDQYRLYELIWKRAMASQMEAASVETTTIDILSTDQKTGLRATGSVILFDGFLKLYEEGRDDAEGEDGAKLLPKVRQGAGADVQNVLPAQHFTEPPPRYSEASLVKRLEELGIGRPSTYASILTTLRDRGYVVMDKNRFVPDSKGRIVIAFLENFFKRYVEYDFTANLEETLDEISNGDVRWREFLKEFWKDFIANVEGVGELRITEVLEALNVSLGPLIFPKKEDGSDPRACPSCADGRLSLKTGKFGAFIGCSNYPNCNFTRQLSANEAQTSIEGGEKILGRDEASDLDVLLRIGRFGPYLQLGKEDKEADVKPKRSSLPKGWTVEEIDLQKALKLLNLPRHIGPHPDDHQPVEAGLGRFGPYVKHGKTYANVGSIEEVFEIGLNRAVTLIAEKQANPRAGRGGGPSAKPLRELGPHPQKGEPVNIMNGRFGPYVKCGKVNATLPNGADPAAVTLEEALELVAAREKRGGKPKAGKKAKAEPEAGKPKAKSAPKKKVSKSPAKAAPAKKAAPKGKAAKKASAK
jgi:DNA topoisomerase-1